MKIKNDLVLRHIGRDYIVINPRKDMVDMTDVYTLNETAAWLWQQLGHKEFTLSQVVHLILQHYKTEHEQAERDARSLIRLFRENGLLEGDNENE